jgi:ribosome-binding factor A
MARKRRPGGPAQPSQRQLRVGELVRHALAELFARGEVRQPELDGVTLTVSEVTVARDLKRATAYVMPLAGANADQVLQGLERSRRFVRGRLARMIELRNVPEIGFALDTSFDNFARVSALLASERVRRDLGPGGDD